MLTHGDHIGVKIVVEEFGLRGFINLQATKSLRTERSIKRQSKYQLCFSLSLSAFCQMVLGKLCRL